MKILYASSSRLSYSLNSTFIKGLKQNGVDVLEFQVKQKSILDYYRALVLYWKHSVSINAVVVGYDSPGLVIVFGILCRKKLIYNAVLSVYERLIISRDLASRYSPKAFYYWLLDFVAVHFASLVIVETQHQADFFVKLFKVPSSKVYRNWIGVDEDKFFYDSRVKKADVFTVLFRGALLPETGAEYLVHAAKVLENEDISFVMQGGGMLLGKIKKLIEDIKPKNLKLSHEFLETADLRALMLKSHLSIGQLSDHPRLDRTIPHKVYESLAMKLPYLTASTSGILELVVPGESCITCLPANANSLAEKILWAKNNYSKAEEIAENGYRLYQSTLTAKILAQNILKRLGK